MTDTKEPPDGRDGESEKDDEKRSVTTSPWEWVAACIGFILVAGAIILLVIEGLSDDGVPPAITLEVDSIVQAGSGYLVEFSARNAGDRTASAVLIEGVLRVPEEEEEVSSVTLDYLPAESRRSAGLFFSHDPRIGTLELRPLGYQRP